MLKIPICVIFALVSDCAVAPCPSLVIDPDWKRLSCQTDADADASDRAVNAISDEAMKMHHPAFAEFKPWQGVYDAGGKILTDFLGFKFPYDLYCNGEYRNQDVAHAIRTRQCNIHDRLFDEQRTSGASSMVTMRWPVVAEEYFEYVDVLGSVSAYVKEILHGGARVSCEQRPFTFVEIGAGYGHWTFAAHAALQQLKARYLEGMPSRHHYLLIDVVHTARVVHNLTMLNSVQSGGPYGFLHFYNGAVTESGQFRPRLASRRNDPRNGELQTERWAKYQAVRYGVPWGVVGSTPRKVRSISLRQLLTRRALPCIIDMIDIDIQGGEYFILSSNESVEFLTDRAKRLHVGLHMNVASKHGVAINHELRRRFLQAGWHQEWFWIGNGSTSRQTDWGPVRFGDGVLSLVNPKRPLGQRCELQK